MRTKLFLTASAAIESRRIIQSSLARRDSLFILSVGYGCGPTATLARLLCQKPTAKFMLPLRGQKSVPLTFPTAIEKGVIVNATARMTEDCQKGIAKFLEKALRVKHTEPR